MNGWLGRYLDYTKPLESPRLFHLWSAIAVVGHALGRRVWVDRAGRFAVYPGQLMVILVSRSAAMRKGTASDQAVKMLKLCPEWAINILPIRTSPQQLFKCLERVDDQGDHIVDPTGYRVDSGGFVYAEELGAWLSKESWMEGMIPNLTRLNNAPDGEEKIEFKSWKATLWNPYLGMLACTTPRGVSDEIPESAIKTGYFGRVLWVCVDSPEVGRANPLVRRVGEAPEARRKLQEELSTRIVALQGRMRWTKQGREWFERWYLDVHYPRMLKVDVDVHAESGFLGRKDDHLLRVAMVLSASQGNERLLTQAIIEEALHLLEEIESRMPMALKEVGTSAEANLGQRVLAQLERAKNHGGWMRADFLKSRLRRYFGSVERFRNTIEMLEQSGEVERQRDQRGRESYRRKWKAGRLVQLTRELKEAVAAEIEDYEEDN